MTKKFDGHVMLYKDKLSGKVYLGTPWSNEKNKPEYCEYDCVAYTWLGEAKISLEIDTEKEFDLSNLTTL